MDEAERVCLEATTMNAAPEYVLARPVLLDALAALGSQRDAVVLVGAQAVYLQVGDADLAVPVMTTDGDLVVDPGRLHEVPLLAEAMAAAGFVASQPGSWRGAGGVEIDLVVPAAVPAGRGAAAPISVSTGPARLDRRRGSKRRSSTPRSAASRLSTLSIRAHSTSLSRALRRCS
jgi:hypothetical protein